MNWGWLLGGGGGQDDKISDAKGAGKEGEQREGWDFCLGNVNCED